jgi:hypothetical protein
LITNSKKHLGYESGSKLGTLDEKNGGEKSHATVPLINRDKALVGENLKRERFADVAPNCPPKPQSGWLTFSRKKKGKDKKMFF